MHTLRAEPRAAMLIESMRDIGYSLEMALADIIDNSITAGATRIEIQADTTSPQPSIAVIDDGCGMDHAELLAAMRPGTRSPLDTRVPRDLGRFGLGLKTASFSQCRRLTVVTRKEGRTSAMRWDLELVAAKDDWLVEVIEETGGIPGIGRLGERGTLVLWENLDRVVEASDSDPNDFNQKLAQAAKHLELVFHRFLEGERGLQRLTITLNLRPLEPFDPFFTAHRATVKAPVESILFRGHRIRLQAYTLPHHNRVTPQQWEHYGGVGGYLKNQGFYLYRARRLIVYGTWFGLARQMEATKLARVRIDIPNQLDADWKIDVKKASAQPPAAVRERLRRLIQTLGATSKRVYSSRGKRLLDQNQLPVWHRVQDKGTISYRLNPEHPMFTRVLEKMADAERAELVRALEMAAASLPLEALFSDLAGDAGTLTNEWISDEALSETLTTSVEALRRSDIEPTTIGEMLRLAEPFRSNWKRASAMLSQLLQEGQP